MRGTLTLKYGFSLGKLSLLCPFGGRAEWNAIVECTRIAVHDVIGLLQNVETINTLRTSCFPQLTRSYVYECLAHYEDHWGEDRLAGRAPAGPALGVKFLLDHDVPYDLSYLLVQFGHEPGAFSSPATATPRSRHCDSAQPARAEYTHSTCD